MAAPRESDDVLSAIEGGKLDPVYALTGEEPLLIERCIEALRTAVLGPDGGRGGSFNLDSYDLKSSGIGPVLDSARTLPMFAKRRLVIARGLTELKADELLPLCDYLPDPNPSTCLVLHGAGKVDSRWKAIAALKRAGFLHDFPRLRDWQIADWIVAEARRRKLAIDGDAARALANAAGPELGRLHLALEQAALHAGDGARISARDVEAVIPESRERGIFELTKAIGAGKKAEALGLLSNLLRHREPPLRIHFMLARQLRQIWRAKELDAAGIAKNELAGKVGISPYFLDDVLIPARRMSRPALERSFALLYEADRRLKSSRVDPDVQITRLVLALADEAAAPPQEGRGRPAPPPSATSRAR